MAFVLRHFCDEFFDQVRNYFYFCLFVQETLDYLKAGLYLAHIQIFTFCRLIIAEIPF